jgi:two-component system, LytTR family, response regulator LytT
MDKIIRTLIVDDERYSRDELKHLLSKYSIIEVVDEADSGESAIIKALQNQPDIVFLDIEMAKMNGMETAKALLDLKKSPFIVFATAYPQFAVEAFRYEAIDYLLKPFEEEQLDQTINRIEKKLIPSTGPKNPKPLGKLAVEKEGEIVYLKPDEILYVYRDEKVSKVVTTISEYEMKIPLKDLETRLTAFSFFRIHKSFLVNLNYVSKLSPWFSGAYELKLVGREEKLSVSRNYVKELRQRLEL